MDQGFRTQADDKGKALLLQPADELSLTEACIGEKEGRGLLGKQAGHQGTQTTFELVLTVAQSAGVIDAEGEGQSALLARHGSEDDVERADLGPVYGDGEEVSTVAAWAVRPHDGSNSPEDR